MRTRDVRTLDVRNLAVRTLATQLVLGAMVLAASAALADQTPRRTGDENLDFRPPRPVLAGQGHAILTVSPMLLEIQAIFDAADQLENDLLVQLASTPDNEEAVRLVLHLQRLDVDRQLDVLRVELRYAQLGRQYDQVFRLRREILELMRADTPALM